MTSTLKAAMEAGVGFVGCLALGHALEALAASQKLGLHLVPLGPGGGADPTAGLARPSPFGEHGWVPVPLGLLVMKWLHYDGTASWRTPESFWGRCTGPVWGQLPTLAGIIFSILPAVLSAWLQWMPSVCSPLPLALSAVALCTSVLSFLFWSDLFFLVPLARATDFSSHAGIRRRYIRTTSRRRALAPSTGA